MTLEETCGTCRFGHILKEDLTLRECHGSPPQILLIPQPRMKMGLDKKPIQEMGWQMVNAQPKVHAKMPACSLYKRRVFGGTSLDPVEGELESGITLDTVGNG